MAVDLNDDFTFLPIKSVAKKIAKKIQKNRKKKFPTQKLFAEHIGLTYSKVSRFEKSGEIQFIDLLVILKALDMIDELQELFEPKEEIIQW